MSLRLFPCCLVLLLMCLFHGSARAEKVNLEESTEEEADEPEVTVEQSPDEIEVKGMDCVPQVKEVEARRPIPIACETDKRVPSVALRYRTQGKNAWETIELKLGEGGWLGEIPCSVTANKGTLKVYVFARKPNGKVAGRVGRKNKPMEIQIVEESSAPPPALPNKAPPDRCFGASECPPEMMGSPACPGTKKPKPSKAGWGSSCGETKDCAKGLACVQGSCESPPKCEGPEDCASGECREGTCHFPDAEELATRLGPPKHHWFGLHFAADFAFMREGIGVCGSETADSKLFSCYQAGNPFTGTPDPNDAGAVGSTIGLGTMRALLSYEYAFSRLAFGARVGWAFRGAPQDFAPLHLEVRALYSLRKDPFNNKFRPYLGLAGGLGRVDASAEVTITNCRNQPPPCMDPATPAGNAVKGTLDAYREGSSFFFGPALQTLFAFSNDSGLMFNLNVMFPDVVLEPSLGYVMAL